MHPVFLSLDLIFSGIQCKRIRYFYVFFVKVYQDNWYLMWLWNMISCTFTCTNYFFGRFYIADIVVIQGQHVYRVTIGALSP